MSGSVGLHSARNWSGHGKIAKIQWRSTVWDWQGLDRLMYSRVVGVSDIEEELKSKADLFDNSLEERSR